MLYFFNVNVSSIRGDLPLIFFLTLKHIQAIFILLIFKLKYKDYYNKFINKFGDNQL